MTATERAFTDALNNGELTYPETGRPMRIRVRSTALAEGVAVPPIVRQKGLADEQWEEHLKALDQAA